MGSALSFKCLGVLAPMTVTGGVPGIIAWRILPQHLAVRAIG